jgi:hypothetical protein
VAGLNMNVMTSGGRSPWGYPQSTQWQTSVTMPTRTPEGGLAVPSRGGTPVIPGQPGTPYLRSDNAGMSVSSGIVGWPGQTPEGAHAERMASLQEALLRQQLEAAQHANAVAYMGGGIPTTRVSGSAAAAGGGASVEGAPSISQIRQAMERLQPTPPQEPTLPGRIAAPTPADTSAARGLAYARAKDAIASEHAAATRGLENQLTARGISGTGLEAKGRRELSRASLAALANVAAQQAAEEAALQNRFAELGYQGNLSQRGQDINAMLNRYNAQLGLLPNPLGYIPAITGLYQAGGALY